MSRYSGRQGRGASRLVRELKQVQAEERNEHYQKTLRAGRELTITQAEQEQLTNAE